MNSNEDLKEFANRASNPMGRVNKPDEEQDIAATDPLSGAVQAVMDNLTPGDEEDLPV